MRLPLISRRRMVRALRKRDDIIDRTEDALTNARSEAHAEIDRLVQEIIDAHIADRHPGQPCRDGFLHKCILGAPSEEIAEDEAARQRNAAWIAEEREARKPLDIREVWWCPNCRHEYMSGFDGHGPAENGCGTLTPVTVTITRRKVET